MNTTSSNPTNRSSRLIFSGIFGAIVVLMSFMAFSTQAAKANSFTMEVTDARLNLGFAFRNTEVLPAPNNIGGNPLPDLWDVRATQSSPGTGTPPNSLLSFKPAGCLTEYTYRVVDPGPPVVVAQNDGQEGRPLTLNPDYPCDPNPPSAKIIGDRDVSGNIVIPASDFRFPIMVLTSPIDGSPVPITLAATGQITGTMDNGNGEMTLNGPMEARVLLLTAPPTAAAPVPPLQSYCAVPLTGLSLTTGISTPASVGFVGVPFAGDNPEGTGALTGTWRFQGSSIPNGNTVYGDPPEDRCARADTAVQGLGGIWLGAGIETPPDYPKCEAPQTGTWPDCVDPTPFTVASVSVSPKNKQVKAGQKVKLTVRVANSGDTAGSATVRFKLSNKKGFSISASSVRVPVAADSSATRTVVVKTNRQARGKKSVVTASSAGKSGKATVKVSR